jgi:DNA-binding transcriptional MerR regulator
VLSIGEFAQLSGLTVKALRNYDERGLLLPAQVNPETGYRSYAGPQLRDAVTIKVLRDAGVPVATVRRALADPDRMAELLAGFRAALAAERRAQDEALAAADRVFAGLAEPVPVAERVAPAVHYAALVQHVEADAHTGEAALDAANERASTGLGALYEGLGMAGNPPVGPHWSSFAVVGGSGTIEVALCWPVADPVPFDFRVDGATIRVGTLPARRELVARWTAQGHDGAGEVAHPAVVALLEAMESRGLGADVSALRQIGYVDADGRIGVELAVAID